MLGVKNLLTVDMDPDFSILISTNFLLVKSYSYQYFDLWTICSLMSVKVYKLSPGGIFELDAKKYDEKKNEKKKFPYHVLSPPSSAFTKYKHVSAEIVTWGVNLGH